MDLEKFLAEKERRKQNHIKMDQVSENTIISMYKAKDYYMEAEEENIFE